MAGFSFKLENILQIKMKIEEQEKVNFGIASGKLREARERYNELLARHKYAEDYLRDCLNTDVGIIEIKQAKENVQILKMYSQIQRLEVIKFEEELDRVRKKLEEAIGERKVFEKLKEKAFEEFKIELAKKEGLEIDELVSYRYSPNVVADEVS